MPDRDAHVFHLFVIRSHRRDSLREHLHDQGIEALIHYPVPPHKQKAYKEWNDMELPITEKIHAEVLSLPIAPYITDKEIKSVVDAVNAFC